MTADEQRAFADLQLRAALQGFDLRIARRDVTGCRFLLKHWSRTRSFSTLDAIAEFLALLDGGPASATEEAPPQ